MADDISAPNEYTFYLDKESVLMDLFLHLCKRRYLATVAGANHSWDANIESERVAHYKGNNQSPEPSELLNKHLSNFAVDDQVTVNFTYNSAAT